MNERMRFVTRLLEGERMTDLCREYGISRKTGYKFQERFERLGPIGLYDEPRAPVRRPRQTPVPIVEAVLALRRAHPTWGGRKLREVLVRRSPEVRWPACSTISALMSQHGLIVKTRRRKSARPEPTCLSEALAPNDVWCVDFKGQFRLGNGLYCYPLTLTDQYSRFILACEGLERIDTDAVRTVMNQAFVRYGMPRAIRSDNGAPFASRGLQGLSRLNAWWISLGIKHERIAPGKPQQNGRHERMHRTLKAETARPAAQNHLAQQERFDRFVEVFNRDRPHEALGMQTPQELYRESEWHFVESRSALDYPLHDLTKRVNAVGKINVGPRKDEHLVFLSSALRGYHVGLRETDSGEWHIAFGQLELGTYDPVDRVLVPANQKVLPMSPV